MPSYTINPTVDAGAMENFQDSFHSLAQQTDSQLVQSGVAVFLPSKGKTTHYARIGRIELVEVDTRNPDKQISDYALDNRQFTKRRFTKTIQIDAKHDINELLKDPTSDILMQLNHGKERVIDRIIVSSAIGSVLTGAPETSPVTTSAATDGVVTVDATAGLTYEKVQEITENFINNELPMSLIKGSLFAIAGTENTALMGEAEFISSDYIDARPVTEGVQTSAGTYGIALFGGSKTGGITVNNPVLPESGTTRNCVVMTRDSVALSMELAALEVTKSATKVNSWDITIDFWINAMRTEGVRVQQVNTTF